MSLPPETTAASSLLHGHAWRVKLYAGSGFIRSESRERVFKWQEIPLRGHWGHPLTHDDSVRDKGGLQALSAC